MAKDEEAWIGRTRRRLIENIRYVYSNILPKLTLDIPKMFLSFNIFRAQVILQAIVLKISSLPYSLHKDHKETMKKVIWSITFQLRGS